MHERHIEGVEARLFQCAVSGASDTTIIFFLKTRKPEVYGEKMRADQMEQIRQRAFLETLGELQAEVRKVK